MTSYVQAIRGAVYDAFDKRGGPDYTEALQHILTVWAVWPLVEAEREIVRAQADLEQNRRHREQALQLLRTSSYLVNGKGVADAT